MDSLSKAKRKSTKMLGNVQKSMRKSLCPHLDCLSHRNQAPSEKVHGENLAGQWMSCGTCIEENIECKCEHSIKDLNSVVSGADVENKIQATSSFAHAVINMIGMLIGLGQLSTPYALENGGWASASLLLGLGVICTYTSILLGKCLDKNPNSRSYTDIGHHAFKSTGRVLTATFIYLEIFLALVSYTISLHDNITRVFSGTKLNFPWLKLSTSQLLTTLAVLVALPSLWLKNLSSISFLSSAGILMSIIIFTSVAYTIISGAVQANHSIPAFHLHKIPAISGLYIFSYAGHLVFPDLHKSMNDPSKFTRVSMVSFASVTALYTTLAFMGAKLFGSDVSSQITLSMPPHLIVTRIALWATVLTPMTKYALEFAPFAIQLEHNLPDSMSSRTKTIIRSGVGSLVLLLILVLALSVPYFEHVLSLTGSLVSVSICIILPCAFYTKISWAEISTSLLILHIMLIAFGSFLAIVGTISTSQLLIASLRRAHST